MADMKFLGFKEVLRSTFTALTTAEKVGYIWFVKEDTLAESEGDIYLGARHYGHFGTEADDIKKIQNILSVAGIVDESGNTVDITTLISKAQLDAGEYIEISGSSVSVKVSTDTGNIIKKGTDGGLFAGLYYECLDTDDLEKTK